MMQGPLRFIPLTKIRGPPRTGCDNFSVSSPRVTSCFTIQSRLEFLCCIQKPIIHVSSKRQEGLISFCSSTKHLTSILKIHKKTQPWKKDLKLGPSMHLVYCLLYHPQHPSFFVPILNSLRLPLALHTMANTNNRMDLLQKRGLLSKRVLHSYLPPVFYSSPAVFRSPTCFDTSQFRPPQWSFLI